MCMKQKLNTVLQQRHCFNPLNTNGDQYLVSLHNNSVESFI